MGASDRQSTALSAGRKTRMGQQGCWHKGMPGQGRPVMPGPKGRRTKRRNRATRGARTARHRAPPVGDPYNLPAPGPTRRRPLQPSLAWSYPSAPQAFAVRGPPGDSTKPLSRHNSLSLLQMQKGPARWLALRVMRITILINAHLPD